MSHITKIAPKPEKKSVVHIYAFAVTWILGVASLIREMEFTSFTLIESLLGLFILSVLVSKLVQIICRIRAKRQKNRSTSVSNQTTNFDHNPMLEERALLKELEAITDRIQTREIKVKAKHVADFSASTLNNIRAKDMGDVGHMLTDLTVELQGFSFDEEQKRGLRGLFKKAQNHISLLKAQYDKAEVNVNKIVVALENHQIKLLKDIALLDKMHELNMGYLKELTMYILAGKQKMQSVQEKDLKALQEKAVKSGRPEDAEATNDLANRLNRFEKKLHDLELTRMVSVQMTPQIRMIQNNDALVLEKIQTAIMNTIPLWKSQMILALSMHHSQQAMQAQEKVTNLTNDLLTKNSEKLKMGTTEIAKEAERGMVDIETLKQTNRNLIDTLDEVRQIQVEGSKRRQEVSVELSKIEGELKQKLLEVGDSKWNY